jgi:hypothetical protein
MTKFSPKAAQKYENTKVLFEKFVKPEKPFQPGRDIKLYNQLIKIKPFEFWRDLELGFKLNSLAFLISEDGKKKIAEIENRTQQQKTIDKNRVGIKLVQENRLNEFLAEEISKKCKDGGPNYELDNNNDVVETRKVYKNKNSLIDFIGKK